MSRNMKDHHNGIVYSFIDGRQPGYVKEGVHNIATDKALCFL